jgi:hypothetical protein
MLTLTTSHTRTIQIPTRINQPRSANQTPRTAKPSASRPSFFMTLLRALAAAAA